MAKQIRVCEHCGAKVVTYPHNLNKTLISGLKKLYDFGQPARLDELDLTNTQFGNFQKLQYWGFIYKVKETHKWGITEIGENFLKRKIKIHKQVFTENKKIVGKSFHEVYIDEVKDCVTFKIEWQELATKQEKLF